MLKKYYVILAVGAFIIDSKKRLLIVKKSPLEKIDGGLWTVPGGKVYPNENIVDTLKREIKEEVNLEISSYQWIGEDVFISDQKYFHAQHFLCKVKKTKPVKLERQLTDYCWMPINRINQYIFHKNIKKRIVSILEKK